MNGPHTPSDTGPLLGYGVAVTRPRHRATGLVHQLQALGAKVVMAPAVQIEPPREPDALVNALREADRFDWIVFTSASGVQAVVDHLEEPERRRGWRIAAVGRSTGAALRTHGWEADLIPPEFTGEALLDALKREAAPVRGKRMLLPLAEGAHDLLPNGLSELGADVTRVAAYRTVSTPTWVFQEVRRALEAEEIHVLTFTSPSTAVSFLDSVGPAALGVPAVVIGPVTAAAAEEMGYRVVAVADDHSVAGLVSAVVSFLVSS